MNYLSYDSIASVELCIHVSGFIEIVRALHSSQLGRTRLTLHGGRKREPRKWPSNLWPEPQEKTDN
jgi:hypothetical protein